MKQEYGYNDEILNQFKLIIYNWNINDVIEYYENDSFCCDYCIGKNHFEYGCKKRKNQCPFEHTETMNLNNLIFGNSKQQDYKTAKLLCLYLMNKEVYNHNNSQLFVYYGDLLRQTGTIMQDHLKSQQYYVRSLSIDNNNGYAHNNYAWLLNHKLNNFDKAEYHYKKAVEIDPNSGIRNYNFAVFLKERQQKYNQSLIYINKACELQPNNSTRHEIKGQILFELNKFEESIDETIHALKLNKHDGNMTNRVNDAKQLIEISIDKYVIDNLKVQYDFTNKEFEGYKLIKWLYDNELLSIKREILSCKVSLAKLKQLRNLLSEMGLATDTIKFRNAVFNFFKMECSEDEDKKTESFYELKYNETVEKVEDLEKENFKLKLVKFVVLPGYIFALN